MATSATTDQTEDASKYQRFCTHNFDEDEKFLSGWKQISAKFDASCIDQEFLKAKLFFYSREYEPVTMKGYKQWLQVKQDGKNNLQQIGIASEKLIDTDSLHEDTHSSENILDLNIIDKTTMAESSKGDNSFTPECIGNKNDIENQIECQKPSRKSETNDKNCESIDNTTDSDSITFAQIVEMVEKGMAIPGVEELNIEPTNMQPKPSAISRKNKPWEL